MSRNLSLILLSFYLILNFIPSCISNLKIPVEKRKVFSTEPRFKSGQLNSNWYSSIATNNQSSLTVSLYNFENVQYFGWVGIGTPAQNLTCVYDTGSQILWVPTEFTENRYWKPAQVFNPSLSSTYQTSSGVDQIQYGTGYVTGDFATDNVNLTDGGPAVNMQILIITEDAALTGLQADGIMGLSPDTSYQTFIDVAYSQGKIESDIFGVFLDKNPNPLLNPCTYDTYLSIGYVPEIYAPYISYVDVTFSGYWATDIIGMNVSNMSQFDISSSSNYALFDTGTSFLVVTTDVYNEVASALPIGCVNNQFEGEYSCPCSTVTTSDLPDIVIYTRGLVLTITAEDYLIPSPSSTTIDQCTVALMGGAESLGFVIMGDVFIRKTFIGYSKSNQSIGIASYTAKLDPIDNYVFYVVSIVVSTVILISLILVKYIYKSRVKKNKAITGFKGKGIIIS